MECGKLKNSSREYKGLVNGYLEISIFDLYIGRSRPVESNLTSILKPTNFVEIVTETVAYTVQ